MSTNGATLHFTRLSEPRTLLIVSMIFCTIRKFSSMSAETDAAVQFAKPQGVQLTLLRISGASSQHVRRAYLERVVGERSFRTMPFLTERISTVQKMSHLIVSFHITVYVISFPGCACIARRVLQDGTVPVPYRTVRAGESRFDASLPNRFEIK